MSGTNKRRTVVMKVNEMTETDVHTISLVKHAANRSPFKIFKSDKEGTMNIDLKKLFAKKDEPKDATPVVVAVVSKSENSEALTAALAAKSITVAKSDESDGVVTLAVVEDYDADSVTFLKMSDDIAVGVTGIQKSFTSWSEDESFVSVMASSGFFPGVRVATDVFLDTLGNIMYKAEEGQPPTDKVSQLTQDFGKYVNDLLGSVPVEAFKYEGMVLATQKAEDESAGNTDTPEGAEETADTGETTDTTAEGEESAGDDAGDPAEDNKAGETITKSEVAGIVTEQMKAVSDALTGQIKDQVSKTEAFMAEMKKSFGAVTTALQGVVQVDTPGDDVKGKEGTQVKKAEGTFDDVLSFDGYEK